MKELARVKKPAKLGNLSAFVGASSSAARAFGLAEEKAGRVELAVEEAVTNVCKYGGGSASLEIEVACLSEGALFLVELSDNGAPFDMTARPDPDLTLPVEQRPIGGLGVFLIKKVCDAVRYRREGGRNILRLEFGKPSPR